MVRHCLSLCHYEHHYSVGHCHYSVSLQRIHYGCGSLQRIRLHYSVCLCYLISLCVFWVVPRSHLRLRLISLYSHYYIFAWTKLQGGGCSIRFVWCKCLILLAFLVRGAVPGCVVRVRPCNLLILLDFFGS